MDEILTVKELAAILKISKSQVYELTNEDKLYAWPLLIRDKNRMR
jgi:excisionase family DNA binding protein